MLACVSPLQRQCLVTELSVPAPQHPLNYHTFGRAQALLQQQKNRRRGNASTPNMLQACEGGKGCKLPLHRLGSREQWIACDVIQYLGIHSSCPLEDMPGSICLDFCLGLNVNSAARRSSWRPETALQPALVISFAHVPLPLSEALLHRQMHRGGTLLEGQNWTAVNLKSKIALNCVRASLKGHHGVQVLSHAVWPFIAGALPQRRDKELHCRGLCINRQQPMWVVLQWVRQPCPPQPHQHASACELS